MKSDIEIYKAVLTLASATGKQLDAVHKDLWDKANVCQTPAGKRHHTLGSDIAALARDRVRKR